MIDFINKSVWVMMNPVTVGILLIVLGLLLRRFRKVQVVCLTAAAVWFYLWSTKLVTCWIGRPLESACLVDGKMADAESYPTADAILDFGGGVGSYPDFSNYAERYQSADRAYFAAALWKAGKAPVIIPSSGNAINCDAKFLKDLGVPSSAIEVENEAKKEWCERWGLENEFEVVDLKRFFGLERKSLRDTQDLAFFDLATTPTSSATPESQNAKVASRGLHVLYLGRRHPLKGVRFLERAMRELNGEAESFPLQRDDPSLLRGRRDSTSPLVQLRIVSDHFGEELERDWAWCDVLCLPTLSENFGLVVAEALERGKRVVVTDGAPAWEPPPEAAEVEVERRSGRWWDRLSYVRGFRDGTDEERVKLLKVALEKISLV